MRRLTIFLYLISGFFYQISYAATLDMQLSRDKIALGETVTISFILNNNASLNRPDFSSLEKDFRILSTNYGSAINMLNGTSSMQTFWQLTLEPKRAGTLTIPEITFGQLKSVSKTLLVQAHHFDTALSQKNPLTRVARAGQAHLPVFIEAEVNNSTPYIQSQVIYTFKLFYQSQLENPRIEAPEVQDAAFMELNDGKRYQTQINGKTFFVFEKNFALFPQKTGDIFIPPAYFRALTYEVDPNRYNDPLYIPFPKSLSLATRSFTLNVKNIPNEFQGTTWLPANDISLSEKWSINTNQWEIGNPVTRTLKIEARGLRADQIPDLSIDDIKGITIYSDPPKRSNKIEGDSVIGLLEKKVTYIPNTSKSFTIPDLKVNWWDLKTNTNTIAKLPAIPVKIIVNLNQEPSKNQIVPTANDTPPISDIAPVSIVPAEEVKTKSNFAFQIFYLSFWFWVALFFFAIWILTLSIMLFKKWRGEKNVPVSYQENGLDLNDKNFFKACTEGNAPLAQQFILLWAKSEWKETLFNLKNVSDLVSDEDFTNALKNLEIAMYANKKSSWDGQALFHAYQKIKKAGKSTSIRSKDKNAKRRSQDLLPPLYP